MYTPVRLGSGPPKRMTTPAVRAFVNRISTYLMD
jgi:hypothetical protein